MAKRRGHKAADPDLNGSQARQCIVTGDLLPPESMIRFVLAPDNTVTPDLDRVLPGRGLWVTATAENLKLAILRNRFAWASRKSVTIPKDLAARVEKLALERLGSALALANRAGIVTFGAENVMNALRSGLSGVYVTASNEGADTRHKIEGAYPHLRTIQGFDAVWLGERLGQLQSTHVVVRDHPLCESLLRHYNFYRSLVGPDRHIGLME